MQLENMSESSDAVMFFVDTARLLPLFEAQYFGDVTFDRKFIAMQMHIRKIEFD